MNYSLPSKVKPEFLELVKNLRGIVFFSDKVDVEDELNWLKRGFRYRDLGISSLLKIEKPWKKLKVLPPIVESPPLDSLLLASLYISPLIILKEESLEPFERGIVGEVLSGKELTKKDIKFNIRLVNYAITDFYSQSIKLALQGDLEKRRKLVEEDLKRYWRIREERGRRIAVYIDPLILEPSIKEPLLMSIIPAFILEV